MKKGRNPDVRKGQEKTDQETVRIPAQEQELTAPQEVVKVLRMTDPDQMIQDESYHHQAGTEKTNRILFRDFHLRNGEA